MRTLRVLGAPDLLQQMLMGYDISCMLGETLHSNGNGAGRGAGTPGASSLVSSAGDVFRPVAEG